MSGQAIGTGRMPASARERVVAVLDIGSSKICCLIFAVDAHARDIRPLSEDIPARLLGLGHQRSKGVKAGTIVDLVDAEAAIRAAVSRAETNAGTRVEDVFVSVGCGRLRSLDFYARTKVADEGVGDLDIDRVHRAGRAYATKDGRALLHLHRSSYGLDGETGIANPRGMAGTDLSAQLHAVVADESPLRNMTLLVERCYLGIAGLVAAPYASGLAVLSEEEANLGATVIDLGGGTTTVSVFADGHFIHADAIAIGANHLSYDIARTLSTPLYEAERIKTLYGNLMGASSDDRETISYPIVGDDEVGLFQTSKARIGEIIRPRMEEILILIRERLAGNGMADLAASRLVLTGGGAELVGVAEFAAQRFGGGVRIGMPRAIAAMPESIASPPFATAIGMLHAVFAPGVGEVRVGDGSGDRRIGSLGRFGRWLRHSFWDEERSASQGA